MDFKSSLLSSFVDLSDYIDLHRINIGVFNREMEQICDRCGKGVHSVVRVSEPHDLYRYTKDWCFACVYEKGLADFKPHLK